MKWKIYIASSWKNAVQVRILARILRDNGHEVFDFTNENNRPEGTDGYIFNVKDIKGKKLEDWWWLDFLREPQTSHAFVCDKGGIDWAEIVILLLPCNRSAHLEAGYGVGKGKQLIIFGDLPRGEFEVMYHFADLCTANIDDVFRFLGEMN